MPAHERPLTAGQEVGLRNLTFAQAEIAAEPRPGHRAELYREIQTKVAEKLAVAKAKWGEMRAREKEETDRLAKEATATIESQRDKLIRMERDLRKSFSAGVEKGKTIAITDHAARWKRMDEQLADKKKQLRIRQQKLDQEKKRLKGLTRDQTIILKAEAAVQAQKIDIQAKEIGRLNQEGQAYVEKLQSEFFEKVEETKRVQVVAGSQVSSLRQQLAVNGEETAGLQNLLINQQRDHQDAMRATVRAWENREHAMTRIHSEEIRKLRTEHFWEQRYPIDTIMDMSDDQLYPIDILMDMSNDQLYPIDTLMDMSNDQHYPIDTLMDMSDDPSGSTY